MVYLKDRIDKNSTMQELRKEAEKKYEHSWQSELQIETFMKGAEALLNLLHLSRIGCAFIGVSDKNNTEIKEGNIIRHNNNLFLIRFSKSQKQWVGRASEDMNWREYDWLKKVGKYCEIVADIHSDVWAQERWQRFL